MRKRRYYFQNEKYSLPQKLRNLVYGKKIKEFPEAIDIESISGCNARCIFCGQAEMSKGLPTGKMSDELFQKIVDECAGYKGLLKRFSFAFDNEPLLDKKLLDKVSYVKEKCSFVTTNITTNGILLGKEIIEDIYRKEIVDEINVSINGITKAVYEKIMGVKSFEKVMTNMDDLSLIHRRHQGRKPAVEINICLTPDNLDDKEAMEKFWQEKGFLTHFIKLDNRSQKNLEYSVIAAKSRPYYQYCRRPFHTMIICWDGVVPLCCADYGRGCVVGDVSRQSLYDIWNGERMNQARKEMIAGKFEIARICANCMMED
jgi:sulfatase maturation enzyme AslB (radical SAM superfamily)